MEDFRAPVPEHVDGLVWHFPDKNTGGLRPSPNVKHLIALYAEAVKAKGVRK